MREVPPMPEPAGTVLGVGVAEDGYTADQIRSRDAIWAGMLEEARREERERCAALCDRKAEGIARVNTYRGRVNAASQHAIDMVSDCAAAIRGKGE